MCRPAETSAHHGLRVLSLFPGPADRDEPPVVSRCSASADDLFFGIACRLRDMYPTLMRWPAASRNHAVARLVAVGRLRRALDRHGLMLVNPADRAQGFGQPPARRDRPGTMAGRRARRRRDPGAALGPIRCRRSPGRLPDTHWRTATVALVAHSGRHHRQDGRADCRQSRRWACRPIRVPT